MTLPGIEIIGFSFVLKIFASWGLLTALVAVVINGWQLLRRAGSGQLDPWQDTRRDRRAVIIWSYPGDGPNQAP